MTNDSQIYAIADALGLSPFVALALGLGLALAAVALAAHALRILEDGPRLRLPPRARAQVAQAHWQASKANRAAQDKPPVWRRQVAVEGAVYVRTLRAQLIAENGGR